MNEQELREQAIKRIKDRREFWMHLVVYVVVNAMLVGIWALSGGGYFWPGWVILGWGVGLVLHGASLVVENRPIRERDIERQMRNIGGDDATTPP
jgi:hypothetical protein